MASAQFILALIHKQAVVGADEQIVFVVLCTLGDHDRGKFAHRPQCGLANPVDSLRTIIAGQNLVADRKLLNLAPFARCHRNMGATGEQNTATSAKRVVAASRSAPTRW